MREIREGRAMRRLVTNPLAAHLNAARARRPRRAGIITLAGTLALTGLLTVLTPASPAAASATSAGQTSKTAASHSVKPVSQGLNPTTLQKKALAAAVQSNRAMPSSASGPTAAAACTLSIVRYGYTGWIPCGTTTAYIPWPDGFEWFVIGNDWSVYHIWPGAVGWQYLGGHVNMFAPLSLTTYYRMDSVGVILSPEGVQVEGNDGNTYCRDWPYDQDWFLWPDGANCWIY